MSHMSEAKRQLSVNASLLEHTLHKRVNVLRYGPDPSTQGIQVIWKINEQNKKRFTLHTTTSTCADLNYNNKNDDILQKYKKSTKE